MPQSGDALPQITPGRFMSCGRKHLEHFLFVRNTWVRKVDLPMEYSSGLADNLAS